MYLAEYLLRRLEQLGIRSIFGVPGDYNLSLLNTLAKLNEVCDLEWRGNCNELNAAYAAEGYARINRISAFITTYGVGELSAINGHAGSYAERVASVHIVGMPSTKTLKSGKLVHHSVDNTDMYRISDFFARVSSQALVIKEVTETTLEEIDQALIACWQKTRPIYIGIPSDIQTVDVDGEARLSIPLHLEFPLNDPALEGHVLQRIVQCVDQAKHPVILIDGCASRFNLKKESQDFAKAMGCPVFVTPMAKSMFDETSMQYRGIYHGVCSFDETRAEFEQNDLLIVIGTINADMNTGIFTSQYRKLKLIELHSSWTVVQGAEYRDLYLKQMLKKLTDIFSKRENKYQSLLKAPLKIKPAFTPKVFGQNFFWTHIGQFFKEHDFIFADLGTAFMGVLLSELPQNATVASQFVWASIGNSLPAAIGASIAKHDHKDKKGRVILFIGDGSLQLTAQELSTAIRCKIPLTIFVINNDGYTIERFLHEDIGNHNSIHPWNHQSLLTLFNGNDVASYHQIKEAAHFNDLILSGKLENDTKPIQLVDVFFDRLDVPLTLNRLCEALTNPMIMNALD